MNYPDKPGWWAFEGICYHAFSMTGVVRVVFNVTSTLGLYLEIDDPISGIHDSYPVNHFKGTWTWLDIPWEYPDEKENL